MRLIRPTLVGLFGLLATTGLPAQSPTARPPSVDTAPRPAARPADVASVDAILASLYDVISGPAGAKRDWNRFRSLMAPNARLMPARVLPRRAGRRAGVECR